MRLTIQPTEKFVDVNGAKTRVWEGETDRGTPVTCFIAMVASPRANEQSELEKELAEVKPMEAREAWPARMVLDNFD